MGSRKKYFGKDNTPEIFLDRRYSSLTELIISPECSLILETLTGASLQLKRNLSTADNYISHDQDI